MDLRKSSITADILNILHDCRIHKMRDIAVQVGVHERTVRRHVQSLSFTYPIETFKGGDKRGGVYLDKNAIIHGRIFKRSELQTIAEALTLFQDKCGEERSKDIVNLIKIFEAYI